MTEPARPLTKADISPETLSAAADHLIYHGYIPALIAKGYPRPQPTPTPVKKET